MIYKILIVAHLSYSSGGVALTSQVVEFPTLEEATICVKQFNGNSVIDAFPLNWRM